MKFFLAPILGITNSAYRNFFAKHFGGIDRYYAPFVSAVKTNKTNPSLLKDLLPQKNLPPSFLVPQILGNDGESIAALIKKIHFLGYGEVNWNMGCPFPTVTRKRKGAGILPYPEMVETVLEWLTDSPCDFSVKMRLGMCSEGEFQRVIPLLNRYPIKEIILHPRTGRQAYSGNVNLQRFQEALELSRIPFIYNGDLFTKEAVEETQKRFPNISGIMLGRGALANPFLAYEVRTRKAIDKKEKIRKIWEFHEDIYRHYEQTFCGHNGLCDKMKGFWEYMAVHLKGSTVFMKRMYRVKNQEQYWKVISDYFNGEPDWQEDPERYFFMEGKNRIFEN